ncbi:DUF4258 domain-containing protein [bacterium]|nr:DUF4258 domain-containing protein [bacterium]
MSETLSHIRRLVADGHVRISEHGYDELAKDDLLAGEILDGLADAELLEDYPDYPKGPCALLLQCDSAGAAIHTVWGIPRGRTSPAVLVTAYRPDPDKWTEDFRKRRR